MSSAADLLRRGLLAGKAVAVTAVGAGGPAVECRELLAQLGAQLDVDADGTAAALVIDAAGAHGEALAPSLSEIWAFVQRYAERLIEAERGGRILLLAPDDEVAVAALENLARTLSVEWARRAITVVTVARAERTGAADVATLVAFLCSQAGEYFSGCVLDMRAA